MITTIGSSGEKKIVLKNCIEKSYIYGKYSICSYNNKKEKKKTIETQILNKLFAKMSNDERSIWWFCLLIEKFDGVFSTACSFISKVVVNFNWVRVHWDAHMQDNCSEDILFSSDDFAISSWTL